jgi:tripartite-type tricarboxylate transporter receptor subunit TctC
MLKTLAGIDILHVPYKGSNPATVAVMSGQVAMQFASVSVIRPHVEAGRLRALAVTTAKRSAIWPELPTVAEGGVKGYQTRTWNCLVAPHGTPPAIIERLNHEVNAIVVTPEVGGRMRELGIETDPGTPAALAAYIADEIVRFRSLIATIKLEPQG